MPTSFRNSLGFTKKPENTRVVVAMSGGVDSSVVAAKLHEENYEVIGITMQLYDHGSMIAKKGACCAGRDIHDARRIADEIGFPHYVLDYESYFKQQVIQEFVESYTNGYTPIPCIRCNERVKFRELLDMAKSLDADCLATGHYIHRVVGKNGVELHRAKDLTKDQSYFLFTTTREQLDFLRFPLGEMKSKSETRYLARKYGLAVAHKPDSQDICFVPDGDYARLVKRIKPEALKPGNIVDLQGNVLGTHEGISHFTIGQRRGLGISGFSEPQYVVRIDSSNAEVIVGPQSALNTYDFEISNVNWLGDLPFEEEDSINVDVKVRSTRTPTPAFVIPLGETEAKIQLIDPELAVSPGQACVFYSQDSSRVLGGGWISRKNLNTSAKSIN
ncbi:MAG: tRNA 2-thiouridine(34) synthase MnmA [Rhodobacteraceae bacterium]|nr:tRNA 2-thiouridine(34) synthase MnmA [Paracoccaceae bacterium]